MNPLLLRQLNQQLVSPEFTEPARVVAHMGAMQAQDYRMARWAVAMRTRKPSEEAFRRAYNSGQIVRIHLLRCTWQLISGQDYRWMLDLCSPKSMAALKGWMASNNIAIPDEERISIGKIIEQTVADNADTTKEDIARALAQKDIHMDDHRLSYHIRLGELGGLLVSGNLHQSKATYSLASHKIKPAAPMERDEALALLTAKYYRSHAPATLQDFVWWSGLNVSDCKRGIQLLGNQLNIESWNGLDLYLHDSCRTRRSLKDSFLLLPPYDEYLIGYKSRDVVLAPEYRHHAHNNSGIFYPTIARNGIICGNWHPYTKLLQTQFFDENTHIDLDKNWSQYLKQRIQWP